MPYGEYMDFSSVTLPGVGGQINASNAISTDQLAKQNKTGRKWSPTPDGGMSMHNESLLDRNKEARARKENLINRDYGNQASGSDAMKEIMGRRKARMVAFQEIKKKEYNFADDTELMSMPQPFASAECQSCKTGKCGCSSCSAKSKLKADAEFREWNIQGRQQLKKGEIKGEFAGPDMSFPIASPGDVSAAWSSVGRAANPRQVMASIIKIAKKFGWESGLPKSVKDRMDKGESGLPS